MKVICDYCKDSFIRSQSQFNEAIKMGWRQFCSLKCQGMAKLNSVMCECSNTNCKTKFLRRVSQVNLSKKVFCSNHCSAMYYGKKTKKDHSHSCEFPGCDNLVTSNYVGKKYCSQKCLRRYQSLSRYSRESVVNTIRNFYTKHGHIPVKTQLMHLYAPARTIFSTWNNAIIAAGYEPNPVMFAKHYLAIDGHRCDSLAEKIVDDWFYRRKIKHQINVPYPWDNGMTADFVVDDHWVEIFGLSGGHKKYDALKKTKLKLAQKYDIAVIELTLKDVYRGNLESKLVRLGARQHHPS